ncbi:MAG: hypothetical protein FD170_1760 [Bacteroidetes bacterium]|nr:MAG: hypothetical protein FD170_1760 [Bacteroidota bacterium]
MNTNTKMRGTAQETRSMNGGMQSSQLMKLFKDELKDLYWAEKAIDIDVTQKEAKLNFY